MSFTPPAFTAPKTSHLSSSYTNIDESIYTIDYLEKSYDKSNQFYKFTYTFYNLLDKTQPLPEKPLEVNQTLWDQALKLNPDPSNLYPSIIFGYPDLFTRIEKQRDIIEKLEKSKRYLSERVNELVENGTLKLSNRLVSIANKYNSLLIEILESISRAIGKESTESVIYFDQLEKRISVIGDNLNRLSSSNGTRVFDYNKEEGVSLILKEQKKILLQMCGTRMVTLASDLSIRE